MLSNQQLKGFQQQLQQTKQQLKERLHDSGDFDLRRSMEDSTGELSSYDNHPGDQGTELYEREKDLALSEHYRDEIHDIERALAAIEAGEYGKCEVCSKEIPLERLEAIPTTTFCIEHTPSRETSDNRPIEEEVLGPPFGRFDLDGRKESVAFDAEDSWQEVASFGTSETPSDFAYPPSDYEDMYIESDENIGYVEDYENFVGVDIYGKDITVYPNSQYQELKEELFEENIQTPFGDLPQYEHDPYVEEDKK
ncbi:yteA family sporulation protein [Peribacillus muralis]|uniref:TraR/DksA C4-type zinc finger protein n=1 Tax=Peribacillus muralis TaxID=264697 RepID=UPI001F4E2322|nr:TraR/DksA C4-type zinc finger protein [Peribacillus muralis]MCK1994259.1 TraR/DksA C4-type zinc finger protein [Peribacillus muralis]MCK2014956.1 TraR/DksA C4-type zinc finger protein [Peribacillus muralis]